MRGRLIENADDGLNPGADGQFLVQFGPALDHYSCLVNSIDAVMEAMVWHETNLF